MSKNVILSACRTPIGSFMGSLSSLKATELGSIVIKEAVIRAGLDPNQVDEVIMGNVLSAGLGQSPARQAALGGELPEKVGVLTINKVCASGLKAVMLADALIKAGQADVVIAGGMESMSNAPHLLPMRNGQKMGNAQLIDSMIFDGLWDIYNNKHMGSCGELCAKEYGFTRKQQDDYSIESYKRALKALDEGLFREETIPVSIAQRKGEPLLFEDDEEPKNVKFEKIPSLRAVFEKEGTITAANASTINDGAAALVIASEAKARQLGIEPLAKIAGYTGASKAPEWFTTAPIDATRKLLTKLSLNIEDIDLCEVNEAFAAVAMAAAKDLKIEPAKLNKRGGGVALGHPLGATGARLLTTLVYALKQENLKRGLVTLCNGGGEAVAMVVER